VNGKLPPIKAIRAAYKIVWLRVKIFMKGTATPFSTGGFRKAEKNIKKTSGQRGFLLPLLPKLF
jgi:hypothetical protein